MMQYLRLYFFLILVLLTSSAIGQQQAATVINVHQTPIAPCQFDQRHQALRQTSSQYRNRIDANEAKIQSMLQLGNFRNGSDTLTIPCVVHVLHLGEAVGTGTNISDAQIQSAIDNMTDRYNGTVGTSLDTKIAFALALRDDACGSTTGIVRTDASGHTSGGDNYGSLGITSNNEVGVKALSKWDHNLYCNIWVVSEIEDNGAGAGTQGYAYFPGAGPTVDGIVCLYNAFGYDPGGGLGHNLKSFTDENTTLTHELGHYLDLYHTFEGDGDGCCCPTNGDCVTDGDRVCDTPAHIQSGTGCPTGNNICDAGNLEDIVDNYMNYASETCTVDFTSGQSDRMRAAACGLRSGLLDGLQLTAPGGPTGPAAAACTPTFTTPNSFNMGITNITINDLDVSSLSSQYDGGDQDHTCLQFTTLATNTLYSIDATVGLPNTQDISIWIDYNNDGDFLDAGENIYNGTSNTIFSGSFTTPVSPTMDTYLRLRVIADWDANTISGSCYNPQYGEVEDYSVIFESAAAVPVAAFSGTPLNICTGNSVTYTDASSDATGWSWNFGSGASPATANTQGPHVVTYSSAGAKNVTLDVTGPGGADNETKNSYVTVYGPVTIASVGNSPETCTGNDGSATTTPGGGSGSFTYLWDAGAGSQTTATATGLPAGTYFCTVTDALTGCTNDTSETVANSCAIPTTQLRTADCGTTISIMGQYLYADAVASVTRYQFEIVNGGFLKYFYSPLSNPTSRKFAMVFVDSIEYNTTYNVRVRVQQGGQWGAWGPMCTVTTPALTPTTSLVGADCGTTVTSNNQLLYYDHVPGASRYRVWLDDGAAINDTLPTSVIYPTITYFTLASFGAVPYNTSCNVRVAAQLNGIWQPFGPLCTVTTPASPPTTQVNANQCGTTIGLYQYFYYAGVPGATRYRFEVVGGVVDDTVLTYASNPTITKFALGLIPNTATSTAYTVSIGAMVDGSWQPFGAPCVLTSGASKSDLELLYAVDEEQLKLLVWPNPSHGATNISLVGLEDGNHDILIDLYDMVGKRVFNSVVLSKEGDVLDRINTSNNIPPGMYLLRVQVDGKTYHEKLVID